MPAQQTQFVTFTCDDCDRTVTFQATKEGKDEALGEAPWIDTIRVVKRAGTGEELLYCGDECEIKAVGAGKHNPPQESKIITGGNSAAVKQAAQAAEAARAATAQMKRGTASFEPVR